MSSLGEKELLLDAQQRSSGLWSRAIRAAFAFPSVMWGARSAEARGETAVLLRAKRNGHARPTALMMSGPAGSVLDAPLTTPLGEEARRPARAPPPRVARSPAAHCRRHDGAVGRVHSLERALRRPEPGRRPPQPGDGDADLHRDAPALGRHSRRCSGSTSVTTAGPTTRPPTRRSGSSASSRSGPGSSSSAAGRRKSAQPELDRLISFWLVRAGSAPRRPCRRPVGRPADARLRPDSDRRRRRPCRAARRSQDPAAPRVRHQARRLRRRGPARAPRPTSPIFRCSAGSTTCSSSSPPTGSTA